MEVDARPPQRSGGGVIRGPWDSVLQLTKLAQEKNTEPYIWAVEIGARLNSVGLSTPSKELAQVLVSHICWDNFVPNAWKFLERAMCVNLVPPPLVLALLSERIIPARRCYPGAYRLYMELLRIYVYKSLTHGSNLEEVMMSIDDVLHLSQIFDIRVYEPGILLVLWIFSVVSQLLDASLDDEGLLELTPNKKSRWLTGNQVMETDDRDSSKQNKSDLCRRNTLMAIEVIEEFLKNKAASRILFLARQNWRTEWTDFVRRLELLALKSLSIKNSKHVTADMLLHTISDTSRILPWRCKTHAQQEFHAVLASGSLIPSVGQSYGASRSGLWIPIDLYLENAMDGLIITATSAVDTLTDIVKSLHAVNGTSWHDTFSGLWIAVLRLIQRERNPTDGPEPRLDTCLSLLLSVTILAVVNIIEEEESAISKDSACKLNWDKHLEAKRRTELISSLQSLGEYGALLSPPPAVASVANQASAKAMMYLSGYNTGSGYFDCVSMHDMPLNCSGNMWHLIVEACIAREVLDTSAYMWPGYVNARSNQIPNNVAGMVSSWSSFMKGAPLTPPLVSALVSTPASSLAEIEKLLDIAVDGSNDDKINAATVLCGASLVRGWNVQEHVVLSITRLLSPPRPADCAENDSYLSNYAPFLNVLLLEISTSDTIPIFSLYGLVPQLAGVLMPICEVFGSCSPKESWTLATGEKINSHAVFSNAFTLLLKLWRFDHPPGEHVLGSVPRSQLTPDYLLMVRNCQLNFPSNSAKGQTGKKKLSKLDSLPPLEPIFIDSFPKLKSWYMQHQACIASTLSGLAPGNPVHQIVEGLLTMLFKKISRGGQTTASGTSSTSSGSAAEELCLRLQLAAWDILEAVPFVLDAALTACAYENLSPRELATGLKDLADFLPASLASIISYLSAEVSRGVWKPASMNGTDWPSPAGNLSTLEQQLKKLLAATGIDVPSLATARSGNPTLPLPLAALLSLTITYKLDKASHRFLNLVGRAVIKLSVECPWPCMPIVSSLWCQKARRWSDFLVFSASRTVFYHNTDAVVQLLRSCFVSTLGLDPCPRVATSGVNALLGHGVGSQTSGGISPVAPGIFYLRVYPSIRDLLFLNEEILSILVVSVKDIASGGFHVALHAKNPERAERKKVSKYGPRYGQVSISAALARVKLASSLGATLVWITGRASLVHALLSQTLPSWFISGSGGIVESEMVAVLRGYALAYFSVLSGAFAWGVDKVRLKSSTATRQRSKVLGYHLKFVVAALDGKISLGCDWATWRAYVSGLVGLMVGCTPAWVKEVELDVLRSLSNGLRSWGEDDLALALLGSGGYQATMPAVEMIIDGGL